TTEYMPLWLVEGFAEYVAYKPEQLPGSFVKRSLAGFPAGDTPPSANFYGDGRNYMLGWLACRMIVERYGEAKLLALYEAAGSGSAGSGSAGSGSAVKQVLGVDAATLDKQYVSYVEKARSGSLP
ncbi:MAG: hypothetical protein JWP76_2426, partial [Dactylosporangium sp.]|nr:hypothetical protein [Dactylosporangium sp.]